jgi:SAM-dependent methyltransferase
MLQDTYYLDKIPAITFRESVATKFLHKGLGLEWGALYWPTPVGEGRTVEFADFRNKEESNQHYGDKLPQAGISRGMIDPHYVMSFLQVESMFKNKYDFFIANHVFEHYPSPQYFLRSVVSCLKDEGTVMLSVPDADKIFDRVRPSSTLATTFLDEDDLYYEHIILVEGITSEQDIERRREEIFRKEEDPHLWVFRQDSFVPFIDSILKCYEIPLAITHSVYNPHFNEMIVVLEK